MALSEPAGRGHWIERVLRPVLVAAMLACMGAPLAILLEALLPGSGGAYFVTFSFLANLEGIWSERLLKRQRITGWGYLGSRTAEAITLLLLFKLGSYHLPGGWPQLWADAQRWTVHPGEFLGVPDVAAGLPLLGLWMLSIHLSRLMVELDEPEETPPPDRSSAEYYMWLTRPSTMADRHKVLEQLGELFLIGGGVLLLALAGVWLALSGARAAVVPALVYFALGIVLLSQAQFSVLRAGWQVQRIEVQPDIARRWLGWAALFLAALTGLALLLPTTYTLGPLRALLAVMGLIVTVAGFIGTLIMFGLAWLLSLLLPSAPRPQPLPPLQLPQPTPPPGGAPVGGDWMQTLVSALFWTVIVAIVAYAVFRFARERAGAIEGEAGWWDRLVAWLRGLWQRGRGWGGQVRIRLARRPGRAPLTARTTVASGAWLALRRLAPGQLVRYFYLSTLQRAAQAGRPRRPSQTPSEYRATLNEEMPELEPDLDGLTEAFIAARYTPRPVAAEEARAVRPLWQRLRAALRRRARSTPGGNEDGSPLA